MRERHPEATIVVADNLKRRGSEFNLARLSEHGISFMHADVRNLEDFPSAGLPFDLLLECSAEPSVLAGMGAEPLYVINTNLAGTINCLEIARRTNADVVFLSTSRVYPIAGLEAIETVELESRYGIAAFQSQPGVSSAGISESFPLIGARSLYGATKLCSELVIEEYASMYGLQYVINRCGVITGPWQMGKADQGIFALWMGKHYFRRPLKYIGFGGTGKQVRDLVSIDDLGDLIVEQLGHLDCLPNRVYNVGGGVASSLSLLETTAACEEITGNRVEIERVAENRPLDVKLYITDNRRVTEDTGWKPSRSAKQTLLDIFTWIRANEDIVAPLWR